MALTIEVDVFSGRRNVAAYLDEFESRSVIERIRPASRLETDIPDLNPPYLGYRGLIIRGADEFDQGLPNRLRLRAGTITGRGLAHYVEDSEVERFLTGPDGPLVEVDLDLEWLRAEVERTIEFIQWPWWRWHPWPWLSPCSCAPTYEPTWWNVPALQPDNNCYNYATNYRTDTFAQPGLAAGAEYTSLDCGAVRMAAAADDLIDSPNADNSCPAVGHLVALVVAPNQDFHWYRKGSDGMWTHKPGGTPATNVDNSGNPITDPRIADRGPYTDFCTFMVVMHGHIKLA
jgi:hypothetical protein